MARLPIQLKKEDNRMSSGGGGWTRFGNNIGESIYNRGRPLCQLWCKWFVCKNEEKIKMIARQYVYSIHKKLGGAFSKGTIECPWGVFSSKCWTDIHSQELLYMGMMKLSTEITFKLAAKGWARGIKFVLKSLNYPRNGFQGLRDK